MKIVSQMPSWKYPSTKIYFQNINQKRLNIKFSNRTMLISLGFYLCVSTVAWEAWILSLWFFDIHFKHPIFIPNFEATITTHLILNQFFAESPDNELLSHAWTFALSFSLQKPIFCSICLKQDSCFQLLVRKQWHEWRMAFLH